MVKLIKELPESKDLPFTAETMNKLCSEYLYKAKVYNNEDVFYLIKIDLINKKK